MQNKRYTLITGASQGIGMNLAMQCARRKQHLVLIALPGTGLGALAERLASVFGIHVVAIEEDLTVEGKTEEIYRYLKSINVTVQFLINNAGIGYEGRFDDLTPAFCQSLLSLNITAVVMLTRLFMEDLKKNPGSRILNVSSLASFSPMPYKSIYAASKAFVYSFSRALEAELRPHGVKVSVLCPGGVPTNQQVKARMQKHRFIAGLTAVEAPDVARNCLDSIDRNQQIIIPGLMNRLMKVLMRWCPEQIRISLMTRKLSGLYI